MLILGSGNVSVSVSEVPGPFGLELYDPSSRVFLFNLTFIASYAFSLLCADTFSVSPHCLSVWASHIYKTIYLLT